MLVEFQILRFTALVVLVASLNATAQDSMPGIHPSGSAASVSTTCSSGHKQSDMDALIARAYKGEAGAQFWTGVAFEQGWCGKADPGNALHWYKLAAAQGDADAQNALGQTYEDGQLVKQDNAIAAKWYRMAAEHVPDLGGAGQGRNHLGML